METSIFHWTDSSKKFEVSVRLEGFEYSGNFNINTIGEVNLRLRSALDNECMIMNISINEESNTFYIVLSDMSYAPPYRVENLTKTTFKICQKGCRSDDFAILKSYEICSFAWSYPLLEKMLSVWICTQSQDQQVGIFDVDNLNQKTYKMSAKQKEYILEVIDEKAIKILRILYSHNAQDQKELIKEKNEQQKEQATNRMRLYFKELGISIVNSQAREIAYLLMTNFKYSH